MNFYKGFVHIFIGVVLVLAIVAASNFLVNSKNSKKALPSSRHVSNTTQTRISFNFDEIFNKKFIEYKNENVGFSIQYPGQAKLYVYSKQEANERSIGTDNSNVLGAINISLVSQLAQGTELYDGLSIDIIYYTNSKDETLDEFVRLQIEKLEDNPPNKHVSKNILINNISIIETIATVLGSSKSYYFLDKSSRYFIEINIFSAGQDKTKFDTAADKIVLSLKLL